MATNAQPIAESRFIRSSWLAWILCGVICLFTLINLGILITDLPSTNNVVELTSTVVARIVPIVFTIVGALILSRQPRNSIGWLLMSPAIFLVAGTPIQKYLHEFTIAPSPTVPILLMTWFQNWSWMLLIFPLFLILLLFPTGNLPSLRWQWVLRYAAGLFVSFLILVTFGEKLDPVNDIWTLPNPVGLIPQDMIVPYLLAPWVLGLFVLTALSVAALFVRYRNAQAVERMQIKWLLFASGVFLLIYMLHLPLGFMTNSLVYDVLDLLLGFSVTLFPIAIAAAILRYRLFDIDVIINRALVYIALTAIILGIYVLMVGYLGGLVAAENSPLISLLTTGLVAVIFQPLRERLQRAVNRMMYGRRDDPVAVLSQLGARLESILVPEQILPGLVATVTEALKLPYAAIALQIGDDFQVQAESGRPPDSLEAFPLIYQGQTIGELRVARRAPGEDFNPADRLLLTNIARQAGPVAHSVRLTAALQQSRQQLVTAREEERRRLRRDLHDGLGPQLASQTLTIDAISKLLGRDSATARNLLEHLKSQSQEAIQDIRRLVYGLRPPALDELGLVEALREAARQHRREGNDIEITTDPNPLPPLPAAVEVAVYRIAQEAITNVLRHAQAKRCIVSITTQDSQLGITITDDGTGYPDNFHFGVGLNSMRERAEELGGTIRFENQPQGGARVHVWLPLSGEDE